MGRFRVIDGTPPPDSPAERVRQKVRKGRASYKPSCSSCGGHEYVSARNGNTNTKLCLICLMDGRRREMT
jgi:hypothetical protein